MPTIADRPPFIRALVANVTGLVIVLGLALLVAMLWQGRASTGEAARQEIIETLDRATERLQILLRATEMAAESAERAARWPGISGATMRAAMEQSLAAFEQRPELSYLGIVLPGTGEYGNLERTASGEILLWLFPGVRTEDPVRRSFILTDRGFVLRDERPADGYDPRIRPFYQAALRSQSGTWLPSYQWIVHAGSTDPAAGDALWGLSYVKALRDGSGQLLGVLDADFDLAALNGFVAALGADYGITLQVIELGDTPQLLAGPGGNRTPLPLASGLATLAGFGGEVFVDRMQLDGEHRWAAARRVNLRGGATWLVVASRADPLIAAPLRRQLYQVLAMGLVLFVGLVLISIRMAHRLGRPLAELEQRVTEFGQYGAEAPAPDPARSGGFRETQALDASFSRMATAIRQQAAALALEQARLKQFNAELEQRVADRTRELQAINQELESFSYSVSHDLRAPLRSISGFTGILAANHAGAMDDTGRSYLQRVCDATGRMGSLIDDLLNLSRVSREQMHRQKVDLSALGREILGQLQTEMPERQVEVHVEDGLQAEGDARLLRIMLENLLGNAWKFTAGTLRARIAFTAGAEPGSFVVSDNGAGFDMRYADKLFGAFQRLHRASEFTGTGIGLATVQRIINRHGGRIQAEAEPGKGATFRFRL